MALIGAQSDPGIDLVPITPNDNEDLPKPARAIRCRPDSTGGTVRFSSLGGEIRDTLLAAGEFLPVGATRVWQTGTVANNLEAVI